MRYLIAFCNRPEVSGDVISGRFVRPIVPDKFVKFCDPYLNRSREMFEGLILSRTNELTNMTEAYGTRRTLNALQGVSPKN